jgi:hypothetical protein
MGDWRLMIGDFSQSTINVQQSSIPKWAWQELNREALLRNPSPATHPHA